jgi:hypothetical protein
VRAFLDPLALLRGHFFDDVFDIPEHGHSLSFLSRYKSGVKPLVYLGAKFWSVDGPA